jgi:hypothetical protein
VTAGGRPRTTQSEASGVLLTLLLTAITRLNHLAPGAGDELLAEACGGLCAPARAGTTQDAPAPASRRAPALAASTATHPARLTFASGTGIG